MSRMTDGGAAPVAQQAQTRTVRCPHCSIELNLPESALGRRLKCPKCEAKFQAPSVDSFASGSQFNPASSLFVPTRGAGSSGSNELPTYGTSSGSVELPPSLAPLRETFDLPLLSDETPSRSSTRAAAPATAGGPGDALALFRDEPKSARKPKGAEARAQARRCSSCSSIVPAGMSLCSRCGLDLDTGHRVAPMELYEDDMPVTTRAPMPPMGVLVVGSFCSVGFLLLSTISLVSWTKGTQGAQFLLIIWLFGLFGGVQFLRRKSIRPVFVALSLAIGVAAVYLIALPIYAANFPHEVAADDGIISAPLGNEEGPQIQSLAERLDYNRITWGVGSLLSYAALAVYLNSPGLKRQFHRH